MPELRKPAFMQPTEASGGTSTRTARVAPWSGAPLEPALSPPVASSPPPLTTTSSPLFEPLPPAPSPPRPQALVAPIVVDHTPRLEASIEALKLESRRLAEQARSDALEIGILVARRILEREIASSIDPLFGLIRGAIRRLGEARNIVVRVSPHDHQRIFESQGAALSLATVTIQPDEALGPGDVMVDSDVHGADARLETRLEALRRELWASMQTEGS